MEMRRRLPIGVELVKRNIVTESDIEEAMITHLQTFLLELGKGFCFERDRSAS